MAVGMGPIWGSSFYREGRLPEQGGKPLISRSTDDLVVHTSKDSRAAATRRYPSPWSRRRKASGQAHWGMLCWRPGEVVTSAP